MALSSTLPRATYILVVFTSFLGSAVTVVFPLHEFHTATGVVSSRLVFTHFKIVDQNVTNLTLHLVVGIIQYLTVAVEKVPELPVKELDSSPDVTSVFERSINVPVRMRIQ